MLGTYISLQIIVVFFWFSSDYVINILSGFHKYERMKCCYEIYIVRIYIYPIYSTVFCVNLGFQEFISDIINTTLVLEE